MSLRIPRLLPLTIAAMIVLLAVKCAGLVLAASAAPAGAAAPAAALIAAPAPPTPPEKAANAQAAIPAQSEQAVLLDLRKRREALDAREAALRARESVLDATAQKLDQRVAELKALQARLEQLDAARRKRDDSDWLGLVSLYEKMKPRDAARIFNDLDMGVLVKLLDHMNERRAAAILAAMNPDKARETTTELARVRERRAAEATASN